MKYEYRVEKFYPTIKWQRALEKELNELAASNWELINLIEDKIKHDTFLITLILKRQKT